LLYLAKSGSETQPNLEVLVPYGTIPCFGQQNFIAPLPLLYPWEGRLLPIDTPPRSDEVGIPLLITINHFTI